MSIYFHQHISLSNITSISVKMVETRRTKRQKIINSVFEDKDLMFVICQMLPIEALQALAHVNKSVMCEVAQRRAFEMAKMHVLAPFLIQYTEKLRVRLLTVGVENARNTDILKRLEQVGKKRRGNTVETAVTLYELQRQKDPKNLNTPRFNRAWNVLWKTTEGSAKMIAFSQQRDPELIEEYCNSIHVSLEDSIYILPIAHILVSSYEDVRTHRMTEWRKMTYAQFNLLHHFVKIVLKLYENQHIEEGFKVTQQSVRANLFTPVVKFILFGKLATSPIVTNGVQVRLHTLADVAFLALRALIVTNARAPPNEVNERKNAALEANVHKAAFYVMKNSRFDALEACRILWWLCQGTGCDRTERAKRVAQQVDSQFVDGLYDDDLKFMTARVLLNIIKEGGYKNIPAWDPFLVEKLPSWFRINVVVCHPNYVRNKNLNYRCALYAKMSKDNNIVSAAEACSVDLLKKKIMSRPHHRAIKQCAKDWRLVLDGIEMNEAQCLAHYPFTADSVVTLVKNNVK